MNIALWIVQVLLAAMFLMAGAAKGFQPLPELAAQMPWVADTPGWAVRLAGISEIVGAIGLLVPALTRIKPMLTPLAAAGLGTVMVFATLLHLTRGELTAVAVNFVLLGLVSFVAYGRAKIRPIQPRTAVVVRSAEAV